ncbi:MAG: type II toxin-antitoxin system VapB family antitoxin [Pseudonocardia sp.]|nr:type II toxin-antitoxin system VapB family antitoxin [Pseudonocardia sp.]
MAEKLVDIDPQLLARAMEVSGATELDEIVNAGLREIIATAARRREVLRLNDPQASDVDDRAVIASMWRR